MTDVGIYAALEGELVAALSTPAIPGVVTLEPASSVVDLAREAARKPAVGVVEGQAEESGEVAIGSKRRLARFTFEVAVVVQSKRGGLDARATLRTILETVRDRVNGLASSQPGTGRWRWKAETPVEVTGDDLLAVVASYQLETLIGR